MKKYMFFAAAAIVALASCNNETPKMDEQPVAAENNAGGMKIAYVEVDSLMTQYEFCKEFTLILQKKSNNARNTLNQKGQALQSAMQNFQQKLNNNGFTSREQAESQQAAIQRQQRVCRSSRPVWRTSSPTRRPSIMKVCATHYSTSWLLTTKIRNTTSS